jgi:protein-S-isoprenylcysteine O-methyltransferase Ste14
MEIQSPLPEAKASGVARAVLFDLVERGLLLLILGWFLYHFIPTFSEHPYNVLLVLSETVTVLLVLMRKRGPMATDPYAWTVAIIGTAAPLFVIPVGDVLIPAWLGTTVMAMGLFLSFSAKLFLNRSFGIVAANRGVKRSGPYKIVRHPMYLGYVITQVAFLLLSMSLWNAIFYAIGWIGLVLRIRAEEGFLSADPKYRSYAASVRYRVIPGLY